VLRTGFGQREPHRAWRTPRVAARESANLANRWASRESVGAQDHGGGVGASLTVSLNDRDSGGIFAPPVEHR
jgi:hypothetical protein